MPEGDTVYRAAGLLDRALSGTRCSAPTSASRSTPPPTSPAARVVDDRLARQAPADPDRARHRALDAAHPPQDGGRRGGSIAPASAGAGRPTRPGWCCGIAGGRGRRLLARHRRAARHRRRGRRRRPPRPRPARSRLGRRRGAAPTRRRAGAHRSARRCSTSATWPASATCTPPSCCFLAGSTRAPASATVARPARALVRRARQMLEVNKDRATQTTTGDLRAAAVGLRARRAALPALRHPDRGVRCWGRPAASGRRTGAPTASRHHRPSAEARRSRAGSGGGGDHVGAGVHDRDGGRRAPLRPPRGRPRRRRRAARRTAECRAPRRARRAARRRLPSGRARSRRCSPG